MSVFEGNYGRLLWKVGSLKSKDRTYADTFQGSNEIKTSKINGVMSDLVTVELRLKPGLIQEQALGTPFASSERNASSSCRATGNCAWSPAQI